MHGEKQAKKAHAHTRGGDAAVPALHNTHRDAGVGEGDEGHDADEEEGEAEERLEARPEVEVLLLQVQALGGGRVV